MNQESERTFSAGNRNPWKYGFSLRACNGVSPSQEQINKAAALMNREAFLINQNGFECEIIAAAVHPDQKRIVYIESQAKQGTQFVDISIKIHFVDASGHDSAIEIESYNPFFGCDVVRLEWYDENVAILVYREKHWTFAYRIGDQWPPQFVKIEDRWQIKDDVLSFMKYKADTVQRVRIPSLQPLPEMTAEEAEPLGQVPPDPYAG